MSRIEVTLLEAILYCQQLELGWVPSNLGVLEACGAYLDDAGFPFAVLLEQHEAQAVDQSIGHCVEGVSLLERLQVFEFCQVLYHIVKLLLVMLGPVKLDTFVSEASQFVCCHSVIGAELSKVRNKTKE